MHHNVSLRGITIQKSLCLNSDFLNCLSELALLGTDRPRAGWRPRALLSCVCWVEQVPNKAGVSLEREYD